MRTGMHVPDLTEDAGLTLRLLDDTMMWRERLVETFEFRSTNHVRVRSSYQVRLRRDVLGPRVADQLIEQARVRIPLTSRPKRPLLGFNVEVADGRGYLPLRRTIAAVQVQYVQGVIGSSPARSTVEPLLTKPMIDAVCSFTPGTAVDFDPRTDSVSLAGYLASGTRLDISPRHVRRWWRFLDQPAAILSAVLDETPEPTSSSEQFLLAIPLLRPTSLNEVERLVSQYRSAILAAHAADDHELLEVIAEYGRRWEVLIDATVPIGEPTLAKIEEDRPLGVRRGGRCTQRLWIGDAPSYHLEVRVFDSAVVFDDMTEVRDAAGSLVEERWDGRRLTDDAISLYTSDPDRPYFLDLTVRLRSARPVEVLGWVVSVLAVSAIALLRFVDLGAQRVEKVAVLSIPTTFAVALLAVREQTSLASRVQRGRHAWMVLGLLALWAAAVHQLVWRDS